MHWHSANPRAAASRCGHTDIHTYRQTSIVTVGSCLKTHRPPVAGRVTHCSAAWSSGEGGNRTVSLLLLLTVAFICRRQNRRVMTSNNKSTDRDDWATLGRSVATGDTVQAAPTTDWRYWSVTAPSGTQTRKMSTITCCWQSIMYRYSLSQKSRNDLLSCKPEFQCYIGLTN